MEYLNFFGFKQNPFPQDMKSKDLLITDQLRLWQNKFHFVVSHKLWGVLTGDVGAGKSTAIRWAIEALDSPEFRPILVTAQSGSLLDVLRQILFAMGANNVRGVKSKLTQTIRQTLKEIANGRVTPILILDEASLLPLEVFRELHTLFQFDSDSKSIVSIILVGQEDLIDKLSYPTSRALASRVTARMHLVAGDKDQTVTYVGHHLKLAGGHPRFFDEPSLTAIHQASGGILRNINNLARCALISATAEKRQVVSADDIQKASTEVFLTL